MSPQNSRTLQLGLVGAGQVAQMCHLEPLSRLPGVAVSALADLRPELAHRVAERHGIPRVFESHRALLNTSDLDGVVVVVNRMATGPIVRDVLQRGLPVLTEKPLTHSTAQAESLLEIANRIGVSLSVGYMKRSDSGYLAAERLLRHFQKSGEYGALKSVAAWSKTGDTCRPEQGFAMTGEPRPDGLEVWEPSPDWLCESLRPAYADFVNVHIHALNWLSGLLGSLQVLEARWDGDTSFSIELDTPVAPVSLQCDQSKCTAWQEGARFVFDRASLILEFPPPFDASGRAKVCVETGTGEFREIQPDEGWAFERQAAAFVASLRGRAAALTSGDAAAKDLAAAETVWRRVAANRSPIR